jgi:hypothetical protein
MAKGNRTTSTARRATAAKPTSNESQILCRLEDEAHAEVFGLQHLSELMNSWAIMSARLTPAGPNMDMQNIGNRIETETGRRWPHDLSSRSEGWSAQGRCGSSSTWR